MSLRILIRVVIWFSVAMPTALGQLTEPDKANVIPGGVRIQSPNGRFDNVLHPEGAQAHLVFRYHDATGMGVVHRQQLSPRATLPGWTLEIDLGNRELVGPARLAVRIIGEDGRSVATPVLRKQEFPVSTKSGFAHPYRYQTLVLQSRRLTRTRLLPLAQRLRIDDIENAGVDTSVISHGVNAYPLEIFFVIDRDERLEAKEGTLHQETADYFASEGMLGLGGKFLELDDPCSRFQIHFGEPASTWGHWIGSEHDRQFKPTHWKFAYESPAGRWEVAAGSEVDRNEAGGKQPASPVTLSKAIVLPAPATRIMVLAFTNATSPEPLGSRSTCPVDLPK